ncbi:MAG: hypothetical protein EBR82_39625 [Caulobacteraceae bacterium]|nr:hypothetical protein [Caulobacteraceae bacterium]
MERILINQTDLGLGLGTAEGMEIRVNHTLGSTNVTLLVDYFSPTGDKLNASPLSLPVPADVLASWGYDFTQIREWCLDKVGAVAV